MKTNLLQRKEGRPLSSKFLRLFSLLAMLVVGIGAWAQTLYGKAEINGAPSASTGWQTIANTGTVQAWYNGTATEFTNGAKEIGGKWYVKLSGDGFIKIRVAKGSVVAGDILRVETIDIYQNSDQQNLGFKVKGSSGTVTLKENDNAVHILDYILKAGDIDVDPDDSNYDCVQFDRNGNSGCGYHSVEILRYDGNVYTVTFNPNPNNGTVTATAFDSPITSGTQVRSGTEVTFTATPNDGELFYAWGWKFFHENPKTVEVTANLEMNAQIGHVTLNVTANNDGVVKIDDEIRNTIKTTPYRDIKLEAVETASLQFDGWYSTSDYSGDALSTSATYNYYVEWPNDPVNVYAKFSEANPTIKHPNLVWNANKEATIDLSKWNTTGGVTASNTGTTITSTGTGSFFIEFENAQDLSDVEEIVVDYTADNTAFVERFNIQKVGGDWINTHGGWYGSKFRCDLSTDNQSNENKLFNEAATDVKILRWDCIDAGSITINRITLKKANHMFVMYPETVTQTSASGVISASFSGGTQRHGYYDLAKNNTLTINATSPNKIARVDIYYANGEGANSAKFGPYEDGAALTASPAGNMQFKTNDLDMTTWSSSSATGDASVTFTNSGETNLRITGIDVVYYTEQDFPQPIVFAASQFTDTDYLNTNFVNTTELTEDGYKYKTNNVVYYKGDLTINLGITDQTVCITQDGSMPNKDGMTVTDGIIKVNAASIKNSSNNNLSGGNAPEEGYHYVLTVCTMKYLNGQPIYGEPNTITLIQGQPSTPLTKGAGNELFRTTEVDGVTMTLGGWKYQKGYYDKEGTSHDYNKDSEYAKEVNVTDGTGSAKYYARQYPKKGATDKSSSNLVYDSWKKTSGFTGNGVRSYVVPVDTWNMNTIANQDAQSEYCDGTNQGGMNAMNGNGSFIPGNPFTLPCRGGFAKFDCDKTGTLTVYILQNGCFNFSDGTKKEGVEATDWGKKYDSSKGKVNGIDKFIGANSWRPFYIADETGTCVSGVKYETKGKILVGMDEELYQETKNGEGKTIYPVFDDGRKLRDLLMNGPVGYEDDQTTSGGHILNRDVHVKEGNGFVTKKIWQVFRDQYQGKTSAGGEQSIIETQDGGYVAMCKAFVRYSFPVTAGKSYYIFSNASKLGICGFVFNSKGLGCHTQVMHEDGTVDYTVNPWETNPSNTSSNVALHRDSEGEVTTIATLERTFKKEKWASICLPFNMTEKQVEDAFGKGTQLLLFNHVERRDCVDPENDGNKNVWTAVFDHHVYQNILAGYPYLIRPTGVDVTKSSLTGDVIENVHVDNVRMLYTSVPSNPYREGYADNRHDKWIVGDNLYYNTSNANYKYEHDVEGKYTMKGLFAPSTLADGDYYCSSNRIKDLEGHDFTNDDGGLVYNTTSGLAINAYRAYLTPISGGSANVRITGVDINGVDDIISTDFTATAIENVFLAEQGLILSPKNVYSISGQLVRSNTTSLEGLAKGVYIVGGVKVFVK